MKVFEINSVCGIKSTGRIATDIYHELKKNGDECMVAYGREYAKNIDKKDCYRIGNRFGVMLHIILSRLTDRANFYSKKATKDLIKKIEEYNPDIIQLHNIHGYYLDVEILFDYLKKAKKPVFWSLHDCWSFTGHCCHFESINCFKWKTKCHNCSFSHRYPKSIFSDKSQKNYEQKKGLFTSIDDLTLIVVSNWLEKYVKQSFFTNNDCVVINNGVDIDKFKYTESDFKKKYNIEDKKIVLGVASAWQKNKGFYDFIELSKKLSDDYVVVMVGVTKKQKKELPDSIIVIERTDSVEELAGIYSAADVFVNLTYLETWGMVNIEALACGTPVITYNTGGSPESIGENCGYVVEQGNIDAVIDKIYNLEYDKEAVLRHGASFDKELKYKDYIELYKSKIK